MLGRHKKEPKPAVLLKKSSKYDGVLSTLDTGASSTRARPKPCESLRVCWPHKWLIDAARDQLPRCFSRRAFAVGCWFAARCAILKRMDESFDRIGVGSLYTMIVEAEDAVPAARPEAEAPRTVVYGMGDDAEILPVR
jgi:hypothetical protein